MTNSTTDMSAVDVVCGAVADRYDAKMLRCWCGLFWETTDPHPPPCPAIANGEPVTPRAAGPHNYDKTAFTRAP